MTVNDDSLIDEANLLADALCKTSISDHKQQQTLVDSMLDNLINSTQENNGSTKALKVRACWTQRLLQRTVLKHGGSLHRRYY